MKPVSRRSLSVLLLAGAIGAAGCTDTAVEPTAPQEAPARLSGTGVPARHLVLFADTTVPPDFTARIAALGGTVDFSHASGVAVVAGLSEEAAMQLGAGADVASVKPDAEYRVDAAFAGDAEMVAEGGSGASAPSAAGFYPRQWHLRAIGAEKAWEAGRLGSSAVTVAILDTGIDYGHPDLAGRVDLSRSVSFVPADDQLAATYFPGRHPVTDLRYHGTHVAATVSSNARVAAGVTSGVTLVGVKVLNVNGWGTFAAIIRGVLHAVDSGADVINMSLGGGFSKAGNGEYVGYIARIFNEANRRGAVVVVSAGNDALDLDRNGNAYPTYCDTPNVVCVSATGPTGSAGINGPFQAVDAPAPYTNYGKSAINVAAPGGAQRSVWAACSQTSLIYTVCATGNYGLGLNGTSMAAPHVSGLAALLVERYGRNPSQIRTRIQQTADDLGEVGTDPYYGKGRINVARALEP